MSKTINFNRNLNKCFYYKNKHDNFNYSTLFNKFNLPLPQTNLTKLIVSEGQKKSMYQKASPGFSNIATQQTPNPNFANADTGATGSYIATRDIKCLSNVIACTTASAITVQVANGEVIVSSHIGELHVPDGPVVKAFIFPGISGSLLSISQFVDIGYTVVYSKDKVAFRKDDREVFCG